jgi:hypothetical protein
VFGLSVGSHSRLLSRGGEQISPAAAMGGKLGRQKNKGAWVADGTILAIQGAQGS